MRGPDRRRGRGYAARMGQQLVLLAAIASVGVALQNRVGPHARAVVWNGFFWLVAPVLVLHVFATVGVDRSLLLALAAAAVGAWAAAGVAYLYARLVADSRDERGALALGAGFGNTGFLGIPLAQLALGHGALAAAVLYDRLAYLVPASSVTVAVARTHGQRAPALSRASRLRAVLLNPPLAAAALAVALRIDGAHLPGLGTAGAVAAHLIGPCGFLLLGLSIPLERFEHGAAELRRVAGALAVRFAGGPLCLLVAATLLGAHPPAAFYLLAGMPSAFNLLALARVYDLRPRLMRLLVLGSTLPALAGVTVAALVLR
jgi:malonate transporter and related proteins